MNNGTRYTHNEDGGLYTAKTALFKLPDRKWSEVVVYSRVVRDFDGPNDFVRTLDDFRENFSAVDDSEIFAILSRML